MSSLQRSNKIQNGNWNLKITSICTVKSFSHRKNLCPKRPWVENIIIWYPSCGLKISCLCSYIWKERYLQKKNFKSTSPLKKNNHTLYNNNSPILQSYCIDWKLSEYWSITLLTHLSHQPTNKNINIYIYIYIYIYTNGKLKSWLYTLLYHQPTSTLLILFLYI